MGSGQVKCIEGSRSLALWRREECRGKASGERRGRPVAQGPGCPLLVHTVGPQTPGRNTLAEPVFFLAVSFVHGDFC